MCLRFSDADRASPSASLRRTSYHRMSSEWRDESRGTDGSNPFSSTDESYKPDHSDRSVRSDEQLGKPRNVSGPWETQIRSLVEKSSIVPPRG
jgi:hypothetical protein